MIAHSTAGLLSGEYLGIGLYQDQFGNYNGNYAWTGSNNDGSIATGSEAGSANMAATWPIYGGTYIMSWTGFVMDSTYAFPVSAISGDLVYGDVPEPASLSVLAGGAMVLALARRRKANRAPRAE